MRLSPSYLRAIAVTYLWIGGVALVGYFLTRDKFTSDESWIGFFTLGGTFMAVGVCVGFVPRELSYDEAGFSCRMLIQGTRSFTWDKLEAYGSGNNVFLLKFQGRQAIQISSFGFRAQEWKAFKEFLRRTYPEKKCSFWFGPFPLKRKK